MVLSASSPSSVPPMARTIALTCSSCSRDSPLLQKSSARKLGIEGPGMSDKLRRTESEPLEVSEEEVAASSCGGRWTRWSTLEASLTAWVMPYVQGVSRTSPEHLSHLPEPLYNPWPWKGRRLPLSSSSANPCCRVVCAGWGTAPTNSGRG